MKIENEQKYFTAEEARQVSDEVNSESMKHELDWIYNLINEARFNGDHSITFSNKTLMKATSEFIKAKGFKISYFSGTQWDPADDTTISW
jgi:hypothetical protein